MKNTRIERVQEEIRRELGEIIQQKCRDPRLTWASVTRVVVSGDFSHARIYVSSLGDEAAQEDCVRAAERAAPFIRSELGRRVRLRKTPELHFQADDGIRNSLRVSQLLEELDVPPAPPEDVENGVAVDPDEDVSPASNPKDEEPS